MRDQAWPFSHEAIVSPAGRRWALRAFWRSFSREIDAGRQTGAWLAWPLLRLVEHLP